MDTNYFVHIMNRYVGTANTKQAGFFFTKKKKTLDTYAALVISIILTFKEDPLKTNIVLQEPACRYREAIVKKRTKNALHGVWVCVQQWCQNSRQNVAQTHRCGAGCISVCLLGKFLSGMLRSRRVGRLRCSQLQHKRVLRLHFAYFSGNTGVQCAEQK